MTFMEMNLSDITSIVTLAIREGCDRVKGHHLWAHFEEIRDQSLRRSSESIRRWNDVARECQRIVRSQPLASGKQVPTTGWHFFLRLPLCPTDPRKCARV
jgi:hypothetical protein